MSADANFRPVRIFLDSNVILSGLMSSQGPPRVILDLLSLSVPGLSGITGAYNIEEIERNLTGRFPALLPVYRRIMPLLRLGIVPLPSLGEIKPFITRMSPKDAPVLVAAFHGKADYLITGDKRGFPREVAKPVKIIAPSAFLEVFALYVRGIAPSLVEA